MAAAQGDYRRALAAVRRRRPFEQNHHFAILVPAMLREEGWIAAMAGDTAGAVRAYEHYLALRTDPDPGPMTEEVRAVKTHLVELVGERTSR